MFGGEKAHTHTQLRAPAKQTVVRTERGKEGRDGREGGGGAKIC